jgi:hypothetical protein
LDDFFNDKSKRDGKQNMCKVCHKAGIKKRRDDIKEANHQYWENAKLKLEINIADGKTQPFPPDYVFEKCNMNYFKHKKMSSIH